jgi:RNA polymerase sigma factor (sigma-70 family)
MNDPKRQEFKQLFDENSKRIFNLCYGYTGDADVANDLMQETFVKVWQHLDKFRNQSQWSTWIYRIGVNTCLSYLRSAKRKPTEPLENSLYEQKAEEHSDREKQEQIATLYKAIAQLGEYDRIIITLVLDEVPYAEIAEIAEISEGNLRVRIHRIKQKLTELYNKIDNS